jgi:DNA mismatch repair protein MutS
VERARALLLELEAGGRPAPPPAPEAQLTLFAVAAPHPVLERLRAVDVERTTPLQALTLLAELARMAEH